MGKADKDEAFDAVFMISMFFLGSGIVLFVAALCQTHWFNMAGVYLSTRIR